MATSHVFGNGQTQRLKSQRSVSYLFQNKSTALHYAVKARAYEAIKALSRKPACLDAQDVIGDTALHGAVSSGSQPIVECLLNAGATPVVLNKVRCQHGLVLFTLHKLTQLLRRRVCIDFRGSCKSCVSS